MRLLAAPTAYRVVHAPFVFVRAAPSTDAEVLSMLDVGACVSVDAVCRGWVRTGAACGARSQGARPAEHGGLGRGAPPEGRWWAVGSVQLVVGNTSSGGARLGLQHA